MVNYCRNIGLSQEQTKQLVNFHPVTFKGKLYSRESSRYFHMEESTLRLEYIKNKSAVHLTVNGNSLVAWFKMKREELRNQKEPANKKSVTPKIRR